MNNFSRASFFAILLVCTAAKADNFIFDAVEDTVDKTSWYAEQAVRAYFLTKVGSEIQKNIPMTKMVEDLFKMFDNIKLVKEHSLRHKLATIAWGAAGFTLLQKIAGQKNITRATKESPTLHWLIHRLLEFKTHKDA